MYSKLKSAYFSFIELCTKVKTLPSARFKNFFNNYNKQIVSFHSDMCAWDNLNQINALICKVMQVFLYISPSIMDQSIGLVWITIPKIKQYWPQSVCAMEMARDWSANELKVCKRSVLFNMYHYQVLEILHI